MKYLEYTFASCALFNMVFKKSPHLLFHLIALAIEADESSITNFRIDETKPRRLNRIDSTMEIGGKAVKTIVQLSSEANPPDNSVVIWAENYSYFYPENGDFLNPPKVIVVNIVDYNLLSGSEWHKTGMLAEELNNDALFGTIEMHLIELLRLPDEIDKDNGLERMLMLFKAKTKEDLEEIESTGDPVLIEAVSLYWETIATDEFLRLEAGSQKA